MLSKQQPSKLSPDFAKSGEKANNDLAVAFKSVDSGLIALRARHDAFIKATKGNFNLFTVLREVGEEVGLHSRWLAFLLNPNATHDCGTLFLSLFLKTLRQGVQPHEDDAAPCELEGLDLFACDTATVRIEVNSEEGRMDIVIESLKWGIIAIENMVWADEQKLQIERYAKELERTCEHFHRKSLLIYLTTDGRKSEQAGTRSGKYYRASYSHHILHWLEECLRATYRFPNINLAIQQYAALVRHITGSGGDYEFMKDVIELLKVHPSLIENMQNLRSAYEQLRSNFWKEFVCELQLQLRSLGIECGEPKPSRSRHIQIYLGAKHFVSFDTNTELRFMIERQDGVPGLWFGLAIHHYGDETKKIGNRITKNAAQFVTITSQWLTDFPSRFRGIVNEWWPLGHLVISDDFLSEKYLAENATNGSKPVAEQVKKFCADIVTFLKPVETLWPKRGKTL